MITDLKRNVSDWHNPKQVDEYLLKILHKKANDGSGLIYGLGHAIYILLDPRAQLLKEMARDLAEAKDTMDNFALYSYIEKRGPQLYAQVTGVSRVLRRGRQA